MCSRWKRAQDLSRFTVFDTEVQAGSTEARVLLKNQVNGPRAGREVRWLQDFRAFILCEKEEMQVRQNSLTLCR